MTQHNTRAQTHTHTYADTAGRGDVEESGTDCPPSYQSPASQQRQSDDNRRTHVHAHRLRSHSSNACTRCFRLFWRRHPLPLLRQYDQRFGDHSGVHARRHRQDQVRRRRRRQRRQRDHNSKLFLCLASLRIQNMRMIDGKPEYKNGLVSQTASSHTCRLALLLPFPQSSF